jgi:type I restriction enzyme S subunit
VERANRESGEQGNGELPEGWAWTTLGECAEVITGNTPSKEDASNYGNFLPLIKPPELNDDLVDDAPDHLSKLGAEKARVLPPKSVLVSCIGILGKTALTAVPAATNQQINSVVFPSEILPKFGFYYLQTIEIKKWLNDIASATTVPIVNKSKFERTSIPIAPLPEQKRIVEAIETQFTRLDAAVKALERAQIKLERYRASVLQAACEGRLVPTEAALARHVGGDSCSNAFWQNAAERGKKSAGNMRSNAPRRKRPRPSARRRACPTIFAS